ncbi:MAG: hypothetical protein Q7R49_03230 [Candidatus Daviesbacteria bacterium]|nr:hypothetical protein [Candidatus Daviesbacteria bacterium]
MDKYLLCTFGRKSAQNSLAGKSGYSSDFANWGKGFPLQKDLAIPLISKSSLFNALVSKARLKKQRSLRQPKNVMQRSIYLKQMNRVQYLVRSESQASVGRASDFLWPDELLYNQKCERKDYYG